MRFNVVGHAHTEFFNVTNSITNPDKPLMYNKIGGSATTMSYMNPSFVVIEMDAKTMLPLNMRTFFIDIDEANRDGVANWRELHDNLDTYSLKDMSPSSMKDLASRMRTDSDLRAKFVANMGRQSPYKKIGSSALSIFCKLATNESHEKNYCMHHDGEMSAFGEGYTGFSKKALFDKIIGDWVDYEL